MKLPLAIVALLLWAAPPLAVAGQETAGALQGAFAVTIAAEDVPPDLIDGASLIGRWQVTFNPDGAYQLGRQDVGPLVTGQFTTAGNQVTLGAEQGVLACPSGEDDAAATYTWEITGDRLLLIAVEESCARRRLLLTTRTLSLYTACPPAPARATPTAGAPAGAAGTPVPVGRPEAAIDTLLRQMSDCWATRTPDRFLNLLSREFRAAQQPGDGDEVRRFTLAMGAPLVWERTGTVALVDATHATASVRQTAGDTIDLLRYDFVYEDGAWRWDGVSDKEQG